MTSIILELLPKRILLLAVFILCIGMAVIASDVIASTILAAFSAIIFSLVFTRVQVNEYSVYMLIAGIRLWVAPFSEISEIYFNGNIIIKHRGRRRIISKIIFGDLQQALALLQERLRHKV